MSDAPSSTPTRHDLYIVQRPLENLAAKLAVKVAKITRVLTEEEGLHCGVRSIANDEYRYDYHIEPAKEGHMKYIAEALANSRGISEYRDRKGSKSQDPHEQVGWVNMSGERIKEESDKLLEKFNGPKSVQGESDPFPIGGGYDIYNQNCQHFAACLVMRLCGGNPDGVQMDTLIKLVWGKIEGKDKYKRVSAQLRAIAETIKAVPK